MGGGQGNGHTSSGGREGEGAPAVGRDCQSVGQSVGQVTFTSTPSIAVPQIPKLTLVDPVWHCLRLKEWGTT